MTLKCLWYKNDKTKVVKLVRVLSCWDTHAMKHNTLWFNTELSTHSHLHSTLELWKNWCIKIIDHCKTFTEYIALHCYSNTMKKRISM